MKSNWGENVMFLAYMFHIKKGSQGSNLKQECEAESRRLLLIELLPESSSATILTKTSPPCLPVHPLYSHFQSPSCYYLLWAAYTSISYQSGNAPQLCPQVSLKEAALLAEITSDNQNGQLQIVTWIYKMKFFME